MNKMKVNILIMLLSICFTRVFVITLQLCLKFN